MDLNACPECGKRIYRDDFQCANCGLLLHPEQATGEYVLTDPAIVRAMLAPTDAGHPTEEVPVADVQPREAVTAAYPLLHDGCPRLIARLGGQNKPLQAYEAHVASFIDGETPMPELARVSRVPLAEVRAVIVSLFSRGMVDFPVADAEPALEPVPIEEIPTSRRARKLPQKASGKRLSDELNAPAPPAVPVKPVTLFGRAAVEKALEEAKARKAQPSGPLQERTAVVLGSPEEFLQRAVALERAGQVDGAIYVLRRAIEKVKKPGPLYNKLALVLLDKRRDYAQAETLLRLAMASDPANSVYQQNLYRVLALAAESGGGKGAEAGLWSRLRGK